MPRPVEVMRAELIQLRRDLAGAHEVTDRLLDRRSRLYREMVGAGVSKAEIARVAGVTSQAVTFALARKQST